MRISQNSLSRWFTADTEMDAQLRGVVHQNPAWSRRRVPTQVELHRTLFRCDSIYVNYRAPKPKGECPYTAHISKKSLDQISRLRGSKPKFCIEVGSFLGHSARVLANYISGQRGGHLLCIDTWCGDINMWLMDFFVEHMRKEDGQPKLYDRFMHNIIGWNLQKHVTPLRVSSIVGARMLKVLNYDIDLIYLDSAHEAGETFLELSLYFDVLSKNGFLFGDDYSLFPAVGRDVDEFCRIHDLELLLLTDHDTWGVHKK